MLTSGHYFSTTAWRFPVNIQSRQRTRHVTCLVRCRLSQRLKIYGIGASVFSNTLDGDIIAAVRVILPGTLATRGP